MSNTVALPDMNKETSGGKAASAWKCPVFKVSGVFSSNMVLQRDEPIMVWGFSDAPGTKVTGVFMGETAEGIVGDDNRWAITFSAHTFEKTGQTMRICDARGNECIFTDVLIGDVWFVGGQSNAELTLAPCAPFTPGLVFDENDNFRLFTQTQAYPYEHPECCEDVYPDIINPEWRWKKPDEAASMEFSAVGWYFAKEVTRHIDVPLGMIMIAAGGACIRELLPVPLAHDCGYFSGGLVREGGYFNSLIYPFIPLRFKAMLFFQGESEGGWRPYAEKYDKELKLLVEDERARFKQNFPFYNVQLSEYGDNCYSYFPWLDVVRCKQLDAEKIIDRYTLSVDMDLGAPADYPDWPHSPLKKPLALRLAKLALSREYGIGSEEDAVSSKPASVKKTENTIEITFEPGCRKLRIKGKSPEASLNHPLPGFSVGTYDTRVPAPAYLTGENRVTVKIPEGADASMVNYAYFIRVSGENANLENENGLPCPAFSIPTDE
ncbi:MAG: hypothetical protein IIX93_12560 [Clostridia bacterium]|nr:hypothetical protein [Clostridia bacterium]